MFIISILFKQKICTWKLLQILFWPTGYPKIMRFCWFVFFKNNQEVCFIEVLQNSVWMVHEGLASKCLYNTSVHSVNCYKYTPLSASLCSINIGNILNGKSSLEFLKYYFGKHLKWSSVFWNEKCAREDFNMKSTHHFWGERLSYSTVFY